MNYYILTSEEGPCYLIMLKIRLGLRICYSFKTMKPPKPPNKLKDLTIFRSFKEMRLPGKLLPLKLKRQIGGYRKLQFTTVEMQNQKPLQETARVWKPKL